MSKCTQDTRALAPKSVKYIYIQYKLQFFIANSPTKAVSAVFTAFLLFQIHLSAQQTAFGGIEEKKERAKKKVNDQCCFSEFFCTCNSLALGLLVQKKERERQTSSGLSLHNKEPEEEKSPYSCHSCFRRRNFPPSPYSKANPENSVPRGGRVSFAACQ